MSEPPFVVSTRLGRRGPGELLAVLLGLVALVLVVFGVVLWAGTEELVGGALVLVGGLAAICAWRVVGYVRTGETYRIAVDEDGISIQRGAHATELGWSDVQHLGFVDGRPPAGRLLAVHPPGIVLDLRQLDRGEAAITSAVREHSAGRFPKPAGTLGA